MRIGTALIAFLIGLAGISTMIASHRLQHIRAVDTIQLLATGMCFGIAIVVAARPAPDAFLLLSVRSL